MNVVQKHKLKGYKSWSDLLDDQNIEAIIIATPPEPRFLLALEALKKGKTLTIRETSWIKCGRDRGTSTNCIKEKYLCCSKF